MLQVD